MPTRPCPTALSVAAIVLTALADLLLRGAAWGVNLGIWALALTATVFTLTPRDRLSAADRALGGLAFLFALLFGLRDSDALKIANALAMAFCLGALALPFAVPGVRESPLGRLLGAPFTGSVLYSRDAGRLVVETVRERRATPEAAQRSRAILRGLLLAAPLVLVFGGLFASADAIFRAKVERLGSLDLNFEALSEHFWTVVLVLPFAAGLLYRLARREERQGPDLPKRTWGRRVGITEIGIVLGSLVVLFGAFLAVQFRYLFGGSATIKAVPGLTFTQYARSGFFELVWVAGLAFAVVVGVDALLRRDRPGDETAFRALGRTLVIMVLCVVASAMMRMKLYADAYGLTELRVYPTVFMAWLVLALALVRAFVTTLGGRPQRLALGLLVSGLGVIFATNLANPDALIVRSHVARQDPDLAYLESLGDDAALAMASETPRTHKEEWRAYVAARKAKLARADWRETNLTRLLLSRQVQRP